MSKHTPGPWTPYNSDKGRILSHWYVRVDGGPTIITVHNGLPDNQDMGNAHLIAAAPAMYEALKAIQAWSFGQPWPCREMKQFTDIDAALAQAEGREG